MGTNTTLLAWALCLRTRNWCTLRRMPRNDVDPLVRDLSRRLLPRVDEFGARMAARIAEQARPYGDGQVVSQADLVASCSDNLRYVLGQLAGPADIGVQAPRRTGVRRAEAGVPESTVLQAFRIGGRFIWELLVENADAPAKDTLLLAAADIWAVSDDLAAAVTDAYRDAAADRATHDRQVRTALLSTVLDGTADAARLRVSASMLGLPAQLSFAVVAAECPAPGEDGLPRVEDVLRRSDVPSVWRIDAERQEGLVVLRARWGLDRLVDALRDLTLGRVGVSAASTDLGDTANALREARLALAAASPHTRDLARYDDQPVAMLLASAPQETQTVARRILGHVLALPDTERELLLCTVRTWLAEAGSTSTAARRMHVHRNTIRYRLRRLEELTGRSLGNPLDLADLHVALECSRMLGLG
jgi:PucR C-terminal helix-turn-helix domain/GGDEF-like domain